MFHATLTIILTILFSILPLFTTFLPTVYAGTQCPQKIDETRIDTRNVNHFYSGCVEDRGPRLKESETWGLESKPENKSIVKDKPRHKVRYYEQCKPGTENVRNCNSNPDISKCDDGTFPLIRQILTLEDEFVTQRRYCPGDPSPSDFEEADFVEPVIVTPDLFRSFPISGSKLTSNPNKFSLRNGNTHFWASKETQEFTSNLSGSEVRIKAIPIQWNWNYGDGATKSFDFPGEAMPNHTLHDKTPTSHSYKETGTFSVGATTLYRGEFSVEGGPWQAIPGQAAVPSEPIEMDVWRTEKELIAID